MQVQRMAHVAATVAEVVAIVAYDGAKIKRQLGLVFSGSYPASIDHYSHMQASHRKEQVMWQDPEPMADVKRSQQRGNAGANVKIWQCRIKRFRNPDPF